MLYDNKEESNEEKSANREVSKQSKRDIIKVNKSNFNILTNQSPLDEMMVDPPVNRDNALG